MDLLAKLPMKHMEICSRKQNTFSLAFGFVYGEIKSVGTISIQIRKGMIVWNMVTQGQVQMQIGRI